jgi:poly [ADP-ribose] polymerase
MEVDDFYSEVAALLCNEPMPSTVTVTVDGYAGKVVYSIRERSKTRCITQLSNSLKVPQTKTLTERYLTCVDPATNAYKFYRMNPVGNRLEVSYGRMARAKGEAFGERACSFDIEMFWPKYLEKISKGYKDQTEFYIVSHEDDVKAADADTSEVTTQKKKPVVRSGPSRDLFVALQSYARKTVREAKVSVPITQKILDRSAELIEAMRQSKDVEAFNQNLLDLVALLQRPVQTGDGKGVQRLMAKSNKDFANIILREDNLLHAMEGSNGTEAVSTGDFSDLGVEVYLATDKQKESVIKALSPELQGLVKHVYRVIPTAQQARFNEYLKAHNNPKVKQFWHGSRNENWMSIIQHSLQLNPNAVVTGKMFGYGIYFAPSAKKSWGYTSYHSSVWAHGRSNTAFMGLYATAYGKPYEISSFSGSTDYKKAVQTNNYGCLHAHANPGFLYNDEIVFYEESAMVLNYIVEFQGA